MNKVKKSFVYETLKDDILQGKLLPGAKLPSEPDLARDLKVGRWTLREAFKRLEDEGYLIRVKAQGTYIKEREIPLEEKVISMLVPYPDFLNQNISDPVFQNYANLFYGAVRAVSEVGWRIQIIAYSRTNSQDDTDWEALEFLQKDSRVIFPGIWYYKIFDILSKRGVHCGIFMDVDGDIRFPWDDFLSRNIVCKTPYNEAFGNAIRKLYARGCRKFLLAGIYLKDDYNSWSKVYSSVMKELGLTTELLDLEIKSDASDILLRLKERLRDRKYDAVLLGGPSVLHRGIRDYYQELGLPKSTRLLLHFDQPLFEYHNPSLSAFRIDTGYAGYQLAKKLMEPIWKPEHFHTKMDFLDRESTK